MALEGDNSILYRVSCTLPAFTDERGNSFAAQERVWLCNTEEEFQQLWNAVQNHPTIPKDSLKAEMGVVLVWSAVETPETLDFRVSEDPSTAT